MTPIQETEIDMEKLEKRTMPSLTWRINEEKAEVRGETDELDAMRQAVSKILQTERYRYAVYDWNYGVELEDLYGKNVSYVIPELKRRIEDALLADDRVTAVTDFSFREEKGQRDGGIYGIYDFRGSDGREDGGYMMAVSYEELMEKKLDRIDDRRDKRQGSLIYDALAPNAAETAQFYADLDLLADRTFADTAVGEDLTRRAAERGMLRKGAVKATFYGRFLDADGAVYPVENGTRFALEEYKYIVLGREADGRYILECETEGACGNVYLGELLPLETMPDLAKATLEELRTDGEDAEGDEELRKRFFASFDADAFGGNIADYKRKVNAMQNVGGLKVYPAWNGGGTVKLVLIDQGWRRPTETELAALQKEIDPESKGEGYGIAPIGHKVTVEGVTEVRCNIALQLSVAEDVTKGTVLTKLTEGFSAYFEELRKNWADSDFLTVRISHLESRALETDGVVDVSDCGINGGSGNLILGANDVPVLGEIEVKQ